MHVAEAAQIRNGACCLRVARRARPLGSALLALLTFLFVASTQVAHGQRVCAEGLEAHGFAGEHRAGEPSTGRAEAAESGALGWSQAEPAAYRREVAASPELTLDASESERSEESARSEDATVRPARVRSSLAPRDGSAGRIASVTWVARLTTSPGLPRGPPTLRR